MLRSAKLAACALLFAGVLVSAIPQDATKHALADSLSLEHLDEQLHVSLGGETICSGPGLYAPRY
jgi:hypothetical protein